MRREAALIFSPNGGSAEKAPPSADGSAPQARPSFSLRPKAAFFTPSKRGASQPPILFSAAEPPRRFYAAPTSVGVRRREPVCRATGVYSIKRGPRCAARSGEQRDGAAWRYQRKIAGARKPFCLPEAEMRPGTPRSLSGSTPLGGGKKRALWAQNRAWPRSARNPRPRRNFPQKAKQKSAPRGACCLLFSFFRRPGRTSPGR